MAKLKDGFYKLTASSIGSDLLVLLAGGGAKPISDFASAFNVKIWGLDFDGSNDVKGNLTLGYNQIYIGDGTDNFRIGWGNNNMYVYHNYYGHYFSTKSGEVMSINSSGNVGIGTISPSAKLHVIGVTLATNFISGDGINDFSAGTVKLDVLNIPTSSGGTTFGPGSNGQVLKSNGTTVYWASDSNSNTWRAIQVNGTQIAGTGTSTYALNFISGTGITVAGTSGSSSAANSITITNAGVRSTTINGNYLRVNTNGTNADLTIPYATTASLLSNTSVSDPSKAAFGLYLKWYSLVSEASGYAGTNYGFPVSNNANGILWLGTHSGPYGWQMGFSSNRRIYARYISNNSFSTTANGGSWNRIAWTSDIPAVTNYYWANVKVSATSSTSTSPTFNTATATNLFTAPLFYYDLYNASDRPIIYLGSNNNLATILRIYSSDTADPSNYMGRYGFSLKYLGNASGDDNSLVFYADNCSQTTQNLAIAINQPGRVGIGTLYPEELLHVSGLIKVTANGKSVTIGSQNASYCHYSTTAATHWFSTTVEVNGNSLPHANATWNSGSSAKRWAGVYSYLGDFSTNVSIGGVLNFPNDGSINWNSGTYHLRLRITDDSATGTDVFSFEQTTNGGSSWNTLAQIYDNGLIYSNGIVVWSKNANHLLRADGGVATFNWSGLSGQPSWLWGGNSLHTYYVYNPANFNVNGANYITSWGEASNSATKRYIWISHNDNSNRAAYTAGLTYLVSTGTLFVNKVEGTAANTDLLNAIELTNLSLGSYYTPFKHYFAGGSNTVSDKPTGVDAFGVINLRTASGWYGQILMSSNLATNIYWRTGTTLSGGWRVLLDSTNSGVSGGGSSGGSSITVNIGGVSKTLTIPTSLPASDVYSWAKQSTKPSYTFSEIGAGVATIGDGANRIMWRTNTSWSSGVYYSTPNNESVVFANKNSATSWMFVTGDPTTQASWQTFTPSLQIKNQRVTINKAIATGTDAAYNLDVNGSFNATSGYINGKGIIHAGNIGSQSVNYANSSGTAATLSSWAEGSGGDYRYIWMSHSDNSSKLAYNRALMINLTTKSLRITDDLNYTIIGSGYIQIRKYNAVNPTANAGSIEFSYYGGLLVYIGYTPNDSYRTSKGLKIFGSSDDNSNCWLEVEGSCYAAHFYENSDIKLKENINLISSSDNIPLLKEFNWKSDGSHSYGLIAQELEEMGYSELVDNSGEHKTVKYSAALSLIVGKLQVKIRELEKEIEILKKKN